MVKSDKRYFSYKQLKAIEFLALGNMTQVAIAGEIGCNPATIRKWKTDPKFMHAVIMRSRALLKEELPEVYKTLGKSSKDGSAQHIRLLLEHLETLEQARSNQATVTFTWRDDSLPEREEDNEDE